VTAFLARPAPIPLAAPVMTATFMISSLAKYEWIKAFSAYLYFSRIPLDSY
jgi:hypothetical protein